MKRLGKILVMILALFLVVGCDSMKDTPTEKVDELLSKYKSKDTTVLAQLEKVVEDAGTMDDTQKANYRKLMERQYENIDYKITEEKIDGNTAVVTAVIEVYDYGKAITAAEEYLEANPSIFLDTETGNTNTSKFFEYKIKQMQEINEKIKYTIGFELVKEDNEWKIKDLNDIDRLKIHGLYY